jgi:hypothetical protein
MYSNDSNEFRPVGYEPSASKPGEFVLNPLIAESHLLRAYRRDLCRAAQVPWYTQRGVARVSSHDDEWIRVEHVVKLIKGIMDAPAAVIPASKLGLDRISMTLWLTGVERRCKLLQQGVALPPLDSGYARRLEVEVARIAKLGEPARTVAAAEFVTRMTDALTVAEAACKAEDRVADEIRDIRDQMWWIRVQQIAASRAGENAKHEADGNGNGEG